MPGTIGLTKNSKTTAAPTTAAPTASPVSTFDPNDYIESEEQHQNQGNIPDTPKPVSTSIPGETGISTNIRVSAQDINSAPKVTAAVTQDKPQAKAGIVNVDFGSYNLKEDTTITVRTLPDKADAANGY